MAFSIVFLLPPKHKGTPTSTQNPNYSLISAQGVSPYLNDDPDEELVQIGGSLRISDDDDILIIWDTTHSAIHIIWMI